MEYELVDLIDVEELQELTDRFSKIIGTAMGIFDTSGKVLFGSGWYDACTQYHRVHPETAERCRKSDVAMLTHVKKGGDDYCLHECENGLMDTATPIVINGRYLGGLSTGQFFLEQPDMEFFARQADEFGFDKEKYLEAIAEVPVFTLEYVEQFMGFYHKLASIIAETGYARLQLMELNRELAAHRDHLEDLVSQKTSELEKAKDSAERANKTKSVFLANMSHELRTPLNAILGTSQLMIRDTKFPMKYDENLQVLSDSGNYLLGLIDEVLEISKIEAGRISLEKSGFDPTRSLATLDTLIRPRLNGRDLEFKLQVTAKLPEVIVSDEAKLLQLLVNLIDNAIKYTEQGEIEVQVSLQRAEKGRPDCLVITVKDNGIGIVAEEQESIFNHFVQLKTDDMHRDGVGLGLSICRQYAELTGGSIEVESLIGEGSTFTVIWPFEHGDAAESKTKADITQAVRLEPGQKPSHILIVEDDRNSRSVLRQLLEQAGFVVIEANNGREAVDLFITRKPDLIWMDMRLPVMSGLDAVREIRQYEARTDSPKKVTPIIALTASAFEEDRDELLAAGCDDFLAKPFKAELIFDRLRCYLGVQFITDSSDFRTDERAEVLTSIKKQLDTLPAEWREEFRLQATKGKARSLEKLLNDISAQHPTVAAFLQGKVKKYAFSELAALFK